jgi:hypothetical protein
MGAQQALGLTASPSRLLRSAAGYTARETGNHRCTMTGSRSRTNAAVLEARGGTDGHPRRSA